MIVYMEITQDDLALPLCVCDYLDQMAEKTGLNIHRLPEHKAHRWL